MPTAWISTARSSYSRIVSEVTDVIDSPTIMFWGWTYINGLILFFLVQTYKGGPFFTRPSLHASPSPTQKALCLHPYTVASETRTKLTSPEARGPPLSISCENTNTISPLSSCSAMESRRDGVWLRRSAAGWMCDSEVWSRREALLFRSQSESSRAASILKYGREKRSHNGCLAVLCLVKI